HYLAPWSDPDGALKKYDAEKDALHAGRKPREATDGQTVKELCNCFLNAKAALRDSGELTKRSWQDYQDPGSVLIRHLGASRLVEHIDPKDFAPLRKAMAQKWGPTTLGNVVQRMRVIFKFAWDEGLISRPVRYGQSFKRPSRKVIRPDRARKGPKLFSAQVIRRLQTAPPVHMQAMTLLGINC